MTPEQKKALLQGVPNEAIPSGSSGLLVPEHLAKVARASNQYTGLLSGGIAGDPQVLNVPGKHKEFMDRLEALMTEYSVDKLEIFWKGPHAR